MHKLFLLIAVVVLGVNCSNVAVAQATNTRARTDNRDQNNSQCTGFAARTGSSDRSENARRCYEHGLALTEAGQFGQAVASFQRALQIDPEYADAYSALGRTYFKLREWQKAIESFNRAASLSTKQREANEAVLNKRTTDMKQSGATNRGSLSAHRVSNSPQTNAAGPPAKASTSASIQSSQQSETTNTESKPAPAIKSSTNTTPPTIDIGNSVPPQKNADGPQTNASAPSIQPSQQVVTSDTQKNPTQASNTVISQTPPAPVTNRVVTDKVEPTVNQSTNNGPSTIDAGKSTSQASEARNDVQGTVSQPKNDSTQQDSRAPAQLDLAKQTQTETANVTTPPAVKDNNPPVPEQAASGTPVAMSNNPLASPRASSKEEALTVPDNSEEFLTKLYRVGSGDVLDIRLNQSEQGSTLYTVTPAGLLEHPLLNEPMLITGLTVDEIGAKIEADLRRRAIIEDPKALVAVRDYASHTVLVSGLVREAGTKFLRREAIPLYVIVADAQPLPEAARVTVTRSESKRVYEIDLNQAADMNFLVKAGDVISLHPNTTQFIYIGGEIKFPGEKTFRRGLTLMQTILAAGGIGPKAKFAEIARENEQGFLIPVRLKLKEIVSGKVADPLLKPGDRIAILR